MNLPGTRSVEPAPEASEAVHQAIAETLRESISLFAHDLSNPLQSMMVLIELTMDDMPAGEARDRLELALGATGRMREMLQSFARVCRVGTDGEQSRPTVTAALSRCTQLLQRRCERLNLAIRCHDEPVAGCLLPAPEVELAILGVFLSALAVLARTEHRGGEVNVVGSVPAKLGGKTARLEFGIAGLRGQDVTMSTLAFDGLRIDRAERLIGGSGARIVRHPNASVRLEFPVDLPAPSSSP